MKDLKHQLIEQLEDSDILEELKRRKLKPGSPPESDKMDQYKINLFIQVSLFIFTIALILTILYLAS